MAVMKPERWNQIERLLDAALELPPDKRAAFLDEACAGDAELRKELDALLASDDGAHSFLEQPALEVAAKALGDQKDSMLGQTIGHHKIISRVGAGGMGEVYLAKDTRLDRKVALKMLPPGLAADRNRMQRFVQEAKAASALNHPNILTIYEIGEAEGQPFIVTEFIEGMTLRERLRSPLEIEEALDIAIQISSALAAAHKVHIIHRDIKPENIMVRKDDGLVKVLDFGLAKMIQRRQPVDSAVDTVLIANTGPGVVIGTVAYMSPEQARGETVDGRTDIWSLGVVLYEMFAGCSPFVAGTSNEIISAILSKAAAPPLSRYSHVVPERLEEIVEKALSKNRDERYQTSKDLLIDLKRLKQSLELKASLARSAASDEVGIQTSGANVSNAQTAPPAAANTQALSSAEYIVNQVKSHKRWFVTASAVVLLIAIGILLYTWRLRDATASGPSINSIAVLPFTNANSDPDTEFLSDGITDNIIERLSQLPGLRVMSHTAVFHYKGRETDPRTIGTELGVEAVLTGRLTKRNDAVTINLELVNAKDNSHIWGEQYDRKLSDLLTVQREIPVDIAEKLRLRLSGESKARLEQVHTTDPDAYQLYLKGRYSWERWTEEGSKQAVDYFEEAIRKDPNYAEAYAGLSEAYVFGAGLAGMTQKEENRRGRLAATKALELDPMLGEAHVALAGVLLYEDWDFAGAEREFKHAIDLSPSYAEAHHMYSHLLLSLGRIDESLVESKKFLELDPVSQSPMGHLAYHYVCARTYDEAIRLYQKDLELYPNEVLGREQMGDAYYYKGMYAEAVEAYLKAASMGGFAPEVLAALKEAFAKGGIRGYTEKVIEIRKSRPQADFDPTSIARGYARLGDKDQAFAWLEKAYADRSVGLLALKENPSYDSLRSDPRYADLLRRVGLPQ
jgi:serine/threonine protein kinase/Tfp pilus assembly protein PilF